MRWLFKLYNKSHVKNSKALFDLMEFSTQCHTKFSDRCTLDVLERFRQQRDNGKAKIEPKTKNDETNDTEMLLKCYCLHGFIYTRKYLWCSHASKPIHKNPKQRTLSKKAHQNCYCQQKFLRLL